MHPLRWSFKAKSRCQQHQHQPPPVHFPPPLPYLPHTHARNEATHHERFSKTVGKSSSLHLPPCTNCATMLTLINYKTKLMTKHREVVGEGRRGFGIKRLAGVNLKLGISSCLAEGCKPRNERKLYQNFPHPQPLPISQLKMIPFPCSSPFSCSSFLLRKDTIWLRYAHVTKQSVVALCLLCYACCATTLATNFILLIRRVS